MPVVRARDNAQRFLIESCDVRGQIVQLDDTWREVLARVDYPPHVRTLLGEAFVAAVLLAGTIKFEGRMTFQIRGEGPVRLLVVQVTADRRVRGLARWAEDASEAVNEGDKTADAASDASANANANAETKTKTKTKTNTNTNTKTNTSTKTSTSTSTSTNTNTNTNTNSDTDTATDTDTDTDTGTGTGTDTATDTDTDTGTDTGTSTSTNATPAAGGLAGLFGPDARLVITIEARKDAEPYQGIVALHGDTLSEALADYFRDSEQLQTRLFLAVSEDVAAGMLLQKLPADECREEDGDGWQRATVLAETASAAELCERPVESLLHSLFHEERVRLFDESDVQFACSCSRERTSAMLEGLGESEVQQIIEERGSVEVTCEFCDAAYRYDAVDVAALFHGTATPDNEQRH